jgi:5-methylcytosine-specific restriction enzyme A
MAETLEGLLESLRPTRAAKVMDLVAEAGVDVSGWALRKDGSLVKKPRANPNFCYEWAFGGDDEPTVLCVWHESLRVENGAICYEDSLLASASRLDPIVADPNQEIPVKFRANSQAKRAHRFDELLKQAFLLARRVRILLLTGDRRSREAAGLESSRVHFRSLDADPWFVHSYREADGAFRLVRDVLPPQPGEESTIGFVDQFSLPEAAERQETSGLTYTRSPEVRRKVLERAKGICECCGCKGFEMANGAVYLETHHVIPLSANGPDIDWNVVAICPNDHRRAHFAVDRKEIRADLIARLVEFSPSAREALTALNAALDAHEQP